jgi:hypothetical protein
LVSARALVAALARARVTANEMDSFMEFLSFSPMQSRHHSRTAGFNRHKPIARLSPIAQHRRQV